MAVTCNSAPVDPKAETSIIDVMINDEEVHSERGKPDDVSSASGLSRIYGKADGRGFPGISRIYGKAYGKKRDAVENPGESPTPPLNKKPSTFYYASSNDLEPHTLIPIAFDYTERNVNGQQRRFLG